MEKFKYLAKNRINSLPKTVGVYCFIASDAPISRKFLYIGKAIDIRQRVKNHFQQPIFKDGIFIPLTDKIGYFRTDSEIAALLLEAELIKKLQPKYNVQWKDNKNYFFVVITKENFPRVFLSHQPEFKTKLQTKNYKLQTEHIGPFVDSKAIKQTLRVLRKIFPYRTCRTLPKKSCLYQQLKLCPAPCILPKIEKEHKQNIKNLTKVLKGKRKQVLKNLKKEMKEASQKQDYEKAAKLRDKVSALENVFENAHILGRLEGVRTPPRKKGLGSLHGLRKTLGLKKKIKRIEGYDISNIQGKEAVGSMVVFENGKANKNKYRKFKIKISGKPNDTAMFKEVLSRRLQHLEWPLPEIMLVDGGIGQLSAALAAKLQMSNNKCQMTKIKIIALAKRENELFIEGRKKPVLLKNLPLSLANLFLQIRDEAHRFALSYHRSLRSKALFSAKN